MLRKSLWPSCLNCRQNNQLINGFCSLSCLKSQIKNNPYSSIPCQHPLRNQTGAIISWENNCACADIIHRIKVELNVSFISHEKEDSKEINSSEEELSIVTERKYF